MEMESQDINRLYRNMPVFWGSLHSKGPSVEDESIASTSGSSIGLPIRVSESIGGILEGVGSRDKLSTIGNSARPNSPHLAFNREFEV